MNMRKGLLSVLALCLSLAVMGQAQLDLQSRAALREMRAVESGACRGMLREE